MRSEVLSASKFLVDLLKLNNSPLTDIQLKKFQEYVCDCMCSHYKDHWFPEKPFKGSAYRCIRINGQLDPLIARASVRIGLPTQTVYKLFPSELTMWIDPWEVSYRIGENGSICILYDQKPNIVSDTPSSTPSSSPSPKQPQQMVVSNRPQQPASPMKIQTPPPVQPSSPAPIISAHHHHHHHHQQNHIFSPSKSALHSLHLLQHSPTPITPSQTPMTMLSHNIMPSKDQNMINCKESLRGTSSGLESVHGLTMERRLFVSS